MLLSGGSTPTGYMAPGWVDRFAYPDGNLVDLNPAWSDAKDVYPSVFDRAVVVDGVLNTTASHDNTFGGLTAVPTQVGHTLVAVDLADIPDMAGHTTDDFSVSITTDTSDQFAVLSQISPVGFVDFAAANYRQMGVKGVRDVSILRTYMQTVFRSTTIGDVFDYLTIAEGDTDDEDYYDYLSSLTFALWVAGAANPRTTYTFRARNGQCRAYSNGVAQCPVITTPAWAVGRSKVGIDVIHIHFQVGQVEGSLGVVDHVVQDLITSFTVTPFTGTL
jgi:hypothetical protein